MKKQIEINGIGQQKYTLSDWKRDNKIFTHQSWAYDEWLCWNEYENPEEFIAHYSEEPICAAKSEKAAIQAFCEKQNIKQPFWW